MSSHLEPTIKCSLRFSPSRFDSFTFPETMKCSNMEMKKRDCYERELTTKEEEFKEEDSIHVIVFTACTFLLMVCLKHFLVEQWRAWVFLILNVILLAILFMSLWPNYFGGSLDSESNVEEMKKDTNEEKKSSQEIEEEKESYQEHCWNTSTNVDVENESENEEEEEEEEEHVQMLSKEELNERVEAFIAMFRKQLISDVKQATNLTPKIEVSCC